VEKKLTRQDKRRLRAQDRKHYEQDWLAPFGSEQEKRLLRIWKKRGRVSQEDQILIDEWLKDPTAIKRGRDPLFLHAAKEKYLGKVVWETAAERHMQLDDAEWLVAYFTAQGKGQKRIASLTHLSERKVDDIIRQIKAKIEFMGDVESATLSEITRWFFGL
jgi:DNA-binding CsgD family transcriptional regulator